MKLVRWMRFTWDLELPPLKSEIGANYPIRVAEPDDAKSVRSVISSAFALDMDWSDTLKSLREHFEAQIDKVFTEKDIPCVVILHGTRIIGASSMDTNKEGENHLLSGPCVLNEYRNRGLGTALLHRSLLFLRDAGVERAKGITKYNIPAAKFLYPKFGSTSEQYDIQQELVGH